MTYKKYGQLTPTCVSNRWEDPMVPHNSDHDAVEDPVVENNIRNEFYSNGINTLSNRDSNSESSISTPYSPSSPVSTLSSGSYSSEDEDEDNENIKPQAQL